MPLPHRLLLLIPAAWLLALAGCPGNLANSTSSSSNQSPVANAGADQIVASGVTVTLHGVGVDPDGDALTLNWIQIDGTTVRLTGDDTDSPVFTAPGVAGTLKFRLKVTDDKGAEGTDDVEVTVQAPPPAATTPRLFVANFVGNSVISFANPAGLSGNVVPTPPKGTTLAGVNTLLSNPSDVVFDADKNLIVCSFNALARSITTYDHAETAHGNLIPSATVQGSNTQLTESPISMAIDSADKLLFVSRGGGSPAILVFQLDATFTGNVKPLHTITTGGVLTSPFGMSLDSRGDLYVADNGTNTVLVYESAKDLSGDIPPSRTITGDPPFTGLFDVFVDAEDRMYAVNSIGGKINTFYNAHDLRGSRAPLYTLTVPAAGTLTSIVVDSAGRGYITQRDPAPGKIYSYDGIATLNVTLAADRTIEGAGTQLNAPIRMFLLE